MSDTCVIMFGRYNPVHKGHGYVFESALNYQKQYEADLKLYLSSTQDAVKNPLSLERKMHYIESFYPRMSSVLQSTENANLFGIMTELDSKYQNIIFIGGSDRIDEFQKKLDSYNSVLYHYDSIQTIQAGIERSDCPYSATMMRECVRNNNFELFSTALPGENIELKLQMFTELQREMKCTY